MDAIRVSTVVETDGEVTAKGLPCRKGQRVEMIVLVEDKTRPQRRRMTAKDLMESGLVGIWADREDLGDSVEFARKLREQAQTRRRGRP